MLTPWTRYALTTDGIHVGYQVVGSGPIDLVLVPYDYSNIEASWDLPEYAEEITRLAEHARVLLFDRRGSGTSDRRFEGPSATIDAQMDDIRAVMDEVGSKRAVLLGLESGAALCFAFAATYPERTAGVIVFGAVVRGTWAPDYPFASSEATWDEWIEDLQERWGTPEFVRDLVSRITPSRIDDERFLSQLGKLLRLSVSPGDTRQRDAAVRATDVRDVLPTIQVPTLVLHRTGDLMEPIEEGRWIAEHVPGATFVELEGDDHIYLNKDGASHIASFLEGLRPVQAAFDRVLATVLFTDIVDSTSQAAVAGDSDWSRLRERHDQVIRSHLARFRGREIKTMGDGFLATFDGPARGVRCAEAIVAAVEGLGLSVRAGLHTGEVTLDGDDVTGLAVAIGARIGALARPSEVLVSQTVKDLVAGSGLTFDDAGEHELKGVPDRWRLYRVVG